MSETTRGRIRVALPNKGRLADRALGIFERAGLRPTVRPERALVASLGRDFEAIFVRAGDVPEYVADGAAAVGVTGADLVAESGRDVEELLDLGFGACRLVVATREESAVFSAEDLPPGTRVATSFPRVTQAYFAGLGIPVDIAPVGGAAEIAPHLGVADAIVDLTSTGSTLQVHGLREIGIVMTSTARVIASREALCDQPTRKALETLSTALASVLAAEEKRYLMANVPRARLEEVRTVLPGFSGPTIVEVLDGDEWVAAHAVVDADEVFGTIADLKSLGAEGVLVTKIERLMP